MMKVYKKKKIIITKIVKRVRISRSVKMLGFFSRRTLKDADFSTGGTIFFLAKMSRFSAVINKF